MTLTFDPIPAPLHMDETGTVRVSGTRVTLDTIIVSYQVGEWPERIAAGFPSVPLADIYAVIAWYLQHQEEVDAYLKKRAEQAATWRRWWESQYDKEAMRERLLARHAQMEAEQGAFTDRG